jgi:predicted PurR-regulated permease PerM
LVLAGTTGLVIFIGQLVSVLFLTYFLLAAGDLFRRRLMQVKGPSLATRKKTLQILNQVHKVSQRYFALVLAMNIAVGTVTGVGIYLLDMRHAAFWGIAMAILHTIPYLGAAITTAGVGLIAYMQFGSVGPALAAAAVPLTAATLIGIWLQTELMGRAARMNAVVVFVALLFFGMIWGGWGLLLAYPIVAAVKIVFEEIERLKPVALLMGDRDQDDAMNAPASGAAGVRESLGTRISSARRRRHHDVGPPSTLRPGSRIGPEGGRDILPSSSQR